MKKEEEIGDILSLSKEYQKPLEAEGREDSVLLWNLQKEQPNNILCFLGVQIMLRDCDYLCQCFT